MDRRAAKRDHDLDIAALADIGNTELAAAERLERARRGRAREASRDLLACQLRVQPRTELLAVRDRQHDGRVTGDEHRDRAPARESKAGTRQVGGPEERFEASDDGG